MDEAQNSYFGFAVLRAANVHFAFQLQDATWKTQWHRGWTLRFRQFPADLPASLCRSHLLKEANTSKGTSAPLANPLTWNPLLFGTPSLDVRAFCYLQQQFCVSSQLWQTGHCWAAPFVVCTSALLGICTPRLFHSLPGTIRWDVSERGGDQAQGAGARGPAAVWEDPDPPPCTWQCLL